METERKKQVAMTGRYPQAFINAFRRICKERGYIQNEALIKALLIWINSETYANPESSEK